MYLLLTTILAAQAQHYEPGEVMAASVQFEQAGQSLGARFEDRQGRLARVADGLVRWEEGLDMLGATDRSEYEQAERTFFREKAVLQEFVTALSEDLSAQFEQALQRALDARPGTEQLCASEVQVGRSLPGIRPRMEPNPECTGGPISSELAGGIDGDPRLDEALREIDRLEWPDVSMPTGPTDPAPGGGTIDLTELMHKLLADDLHRIDRQDAEGRLAIEAALEQGKAPRSLTAEAARLDAITAASRRAAAQPVIAAAEKALAKWTKGAPADQTPQWCVRPPVFGGCGNDASSTWVPRLTEDKRVLKTAR